jgi:hypothetical protein
MQSKKLRQLRPLRLQVRYFQIQIIQQNEL